MRDFVSLDTFMSAYLGPSRLYITGSDDINECIDFYIKTEGVDIHQELIDDIENYLDQFGNEKELEENFYKRYRHSDYNTPILDFLREVQNKVN